MKISKTKQAVHYQVTTYLCVKSLCIYPAASSPRGYGSCPHTSSIALQSSPSLLRCTLLYYLHRFNLQAHTQATTSLEIQERFLSYMLLPGRVGTMG